MKFSEISYISEKIYGYLRIGLLNKDVLKLLRFGIDLKFGILLNSFLLASKKNNVEKMKYFYKEFQYLNYLKFVYLKKNIKNCTNFNSYVIANGFDNF